MATWTLKTQHKKNAETRTLLQKDDVTIAVIEGFRWGTVYLTTEGEEKPDVDLVNPDGINTYDIPDTEWDLESFDDGWYSNIEVVEGELSDEELDEIQEIYGEDNISGLEDAGWDDLGEQEWWFHGPLQLEDEDGNIVGQGEPDNA